MSDDRDFPDVEPLEPNTRKTGRPTKLTPELQERIVRGVRDGVYQSTVCALVGITYQTLLNWKARGEEELDRLADNPRARLRSDEAPFVAFFDALTRAEAEAENRNVALLQRAGEGRPWSRTTTTRRELRAKDDPDKVLGEEVETKIVEGAEYDWRATLAYLERRFPEHWRKRQDIDLSGEVAGGVLIVPGMSDNPGEWEELARDQQAELMKRAAAVASEGLGALDEDEEGDG